MMIVLVLTIYAVLVFLDVLHLLDAIVLGALFDGSLVRHCLKVAVYCWLLSRLC